MYTYIQYTRYIITCFILEFLSPRPCERLKTLGIMGDQLRAVLKPSVSYCNDVQGGFRRPLIVHHDAERRHDVGCRSLQIANWKKKVTWDTGFFRHNRVPIEGSPKTPQYHRWPWWSIDCLNYAPMMPREVSARLRLTLADKRLV